MNSTEHVVATTPATRAVSKQEEKESLFSELSRKQTFWVTKADGTRGCQLTKVDDYTAEYYDAKGHRRTAPVRREQPVTTIVNK